MAVTGFHLPLRPVSAVCLLLLMTCSTGALGGDGDGFYLPTPAAPGNASPAPPAEGLFTPRLAVNTVLPHSENSRVPLPEPFTADANLPQGQDGEQRPDPDVWDRLGFDFDLALDDARNFYSWPGIGGLAFGIAAAAPLANTPADRHIRDWYQQHVRNGQLDGVANFTTYAGQLWVLVPLAFETSALLGKAGDDYWEDGGWYEWSNRSLRAIALGYPPAVALYGILGSGRPDHNDSSWSPFRYFHGVSGHSFIGAVPFLTAASMTDNIFLQAPLVVGSLATGWARLNNDKHYFSQVALGWWIAFLSVHAVGQTQEQRSHFLVVPCTTEGPGISLQFRF